MTADASNERYEQARQRVEAKMGFFTNLAIFVVINVVFLFVAGWDWLWVTLFWGIGIAFHAWSVFFRDSGKVADWKERQIQKELGRADQPTEPPKPTPASSEAPGPSDDPTVS
jgi:2TM domain